MEGVKKKFFKWFFFPPINARSGGSGKWCDPYLADCPVVASQSVLGLVRNRSCCLLVASHC